MRPTNPHVSSLFLLTILVFFFLNLPGFVCGQEPDQKINHAAELFYAEKYDQAATELEEALPRVEETYGANDTVVLTELLSMLGTACQYTQQFEKAEKYFLKSKSIFEARQNTHGPGYSITLNNLAVLYEELGDLQKAEPIILIPVGHLSNHECPVCVENEIRRRFCLRY